MTFQIHKGTVLFAPVVLPDAVERWAAERIPAAWRAARRARDESSDGNDYHLTLVPPTDKEKVAFAEVFLASSEGFGIAEDDLAALYTIGVVHARDVCFAVCVFVGGQGVLQSLGSDASETTFHATLGFDQHDNHDMDKSFRALTPASPIFYDEVEKMVTAAMAALRTGQRGARAELVSVARAVVRHLHETVDATNLMLHKAYIALCLSTNEERVESLRGMVKSGHVGAGLLALHRLGRNDLVVSLLEEQPDRTVMVDSREHADTLVTVVNDVCAADGNPGKQWSVVVPEKNKKEGEAVSVVLMRTPLNFSCVVPGALYASGSVQSKHTPLLQALGVTTIVSLVETTGTSLADAKTSPFSFVHVPVVDREAPSEAQLEQILTALDPRTHPNDIAIVHCLGGRGRTAFVVLAYLMAFKALSLEEAFAAIQSRDTILSDSQKAALRELALRHQEAHITTPPPVTDSADQTESAEPGAGATKPSKVGQALRKVDAIILTGLPGSGKSTLAKHLAENCPFIRRISQDESGRQDALKQLGAVKSREVALVDRCALTPQERAEWRPARAKRVLCIFMSTPTEVAVYRAKHRTGHETLSGPSAERIITTLEKTMVPPNAEKEDFCEVITLSGESEVAYQVEAWGLPPLTPPPLDAPTIVKFPRTRHLINLGAASRDDLVLTKGDIKSFLEAPVYVEEKIDGANFGISIDPSSYEIVTQNRSHVVNSGYHAQFSKLTPWLSAHSAVLYDILEPGREVLFGEWLVAQHSIHYTRLPGYFVAFDLYDKITNTFCSRPELVARLEGSGIPVIRCIAGPRVFTPQELINLVQSDSAYYDGRVEGIYVRRCEGKYTLDRAKVVRTDFLSGNEHWTRKGVVLNQVIRPEDE